jgi:hypothetical protein
MRSDRVGSDNIAAFDGDPKRITIFRHICIVSSFRANVVLMISTVNLPVEAQSKCTPTPGPKTPLSMKSSLNQDQPVTNPLMLVEATQMRFRIRPVEGLVAEELKRL